MVTVRNEPDPTWTDWELCKTVVPCPPVSLVGNKHTFFSFFLFGCDPGSNRVMRVEFL